MNKKTQQKLLNIVKQNYEDIADDFSNTRNYIWPELKKIIVQTPRWGVSKINTLDLGCGNGRLLELFCGKDAIYRVSYTGLEQSSKLAQYAREYVTRNNIKNAKIITGDILNIKNLINEKFDLILLVAVLPHIPSHEMRLELLKKIKNYLKSDSQLVITCWDLHASKKHRKLIFKNNLKKIFGLNKMDFGDILFSGFNKETPRYYHAFTEKSLKKLLKQAGFSIEKIYSDKKNIYAICKS